MPYAASYSEYILMTFISFAMHPEILMFSHTKPQKGISINFPLSASGDDEPSQRNDMNVPGLVVGVVFGSAAAALLVLGGWFVLKKFTWVGGLNAFD